MKLPIDPGIPPTIEQQLQMRELVTVALAAALTYATPDVHEWPIVGSSIGGGAMHEVTPKVLYDINAIVVGALGAALSCLAQQLGVSFPMLVAEVGKTPFSADYNNGVYKEAMSRAARAVMARHLEVCNPCRRHYGTADVAADGGLS